MSTMNSLVDKRDHWERHGFGLWLLRDRATGTMVGRGGLQYTDAIGGAEVEATELMLMMLPPPGPKCFTASWDARIKPRTLRSNSLWKWPGVTSASGTNS